MNATIISIGNELLNGKTVNSNATFIGGRLYEIGILTRKIITIRDEPEQIQQTLHQAMAEAEVIVLTGGLGPTHDDITLKTLAEYFQSQLIFKEAILKKIEEKFRRRGMVMPAVNRNQALVPDKAEILDNPVGTAPGIHFFESGKHVFALPGVPREMRGLIDEAVIPCLKKITGAQPMTVKLYRTTGIAESKIYEVCRDMFTGFPGFEIAFLPKFTGVDIRVAATKSAGKEEDFGQFEKSLYKLVGDYIYTRGTEEIEAVIGRLLADRKLTMAVAESCTGGLVQHRITNVPGSSDYLLGGMVTYSNQSKIDQLGVHRESLEKHGAVSAEVAREMAAGVRAVLGADIGLSTTGIAGPGGATPTKPVGLVYLGLATSEEVIAKKLLLGNDRLINKERATQAALDLVRRQLLGLKIGSA